MSSIIAPFILSSGLYSAAKIVNENAYNASSAGISGTRARRSIVNTENPDGPKGSTKVFYPINNLEWEDQSQGALERTNNPFHIALDGAGLLELSNGNFTRNGNLLLSPEGVLQTSSGIVIKNKKGGGGIVIDRNPEETKIDRYGNVYDDNGNQWGQISLIEFEDPDSLEKAGNNELAATSDPGQPAEKTKVLQGFLEKSNISLTSIVSESSTWGMLRGQMASMIKTLFGFYKELPSQILYQA